MKLYHTTLKNNLSNILKEGLKPSKIGIVYLSEKPNSWWQGENYITLEIDMTDSKNKLTTFNNPDLDEVLCWGNIEPNRIEVLGKGYINENGRRNKRISKRTRRTPLSKLSQLVNINNGFVWHLNGF